MIYSRKWVSRGAHYVLCVTLKCVRSSWKLNLTSVKSRFWLHLWFVCQGKERALLTDFYFPYFMSFIQNTLVVIAHTFSHIKTFTSLFTSQHNLLISAHAYAFAQLALLIQSPAPGDDRAVVNFQPLINQIRKVRAERFSLRSDAPFANLIDTRKNTHQSDLVKHDLKPPKDRPTDRNRWSRSKITFH